VRVADWRPVPCRGRDESSDSSAPERANASDSAAPKPANNLGRAVTGAASSSTSPAWPGGDIAKNQRVIPSSNTAAEVNSINGKRSING
jgi:hypothetical protein